MNITGERQIRASCDEVYAALNDPAILQAAIPGCESLERKSDTELAATVTLKIGPIKASFAGEVSLSDLKPPSSYTITGKGSGGAAGHASGTAKVKLSEQDGGTRLNYEVEAKIGGKIAQLGSRLIDGTARKLAEQFFAKFAEQVEGPAEPAAAGASLPRWLWPALALVVAGGIVVALSV